MLPNTNTPNFLNSRLGLANERDASGSGKRVRTERKSAVTEKVLNRFWKLLDAPRVQERIALTMQELATYQAREGIFTKLYVLENAKTMPPAQWWATYGKHLPRLSSVARRVLAQPVCASAAERNWSVYGAVKTKARSRMGHAVGDKLVYCHEALHMRTKLQKASYRQEAEKCKWDTDSDSDVSDDESDLAV